MLDRFVYGSVERISPESPVPILSVKHEDSMLGGAGNALANVAGLGARASILSILGDDEAGQEIITLSKALGLQDTDLHYVIDSKRQTTIKTRHLAGHQQLLRSDSEDLTPVTDDITQKLMTIFKDIVKNHDCILISDYGKGLLQPALLKNIIDTANKAGIPVIVDPKGRDFSIYAGAYAVTPNKKELHDAANDMDVTTDQDVEKAGQHIIETANIENIIATRGPDGISIISKAQKDIHIPTEAIEVYDVSGAGDAVIATIAASIGAQASLHEAAMLANVAGGIAVSKVGTAPVTKEEMMRALAETKDPIQSNEQALETIKRWRARGYKIGMTNGCFDILHQGHVQYLQEARQLCDRLIIGLNKDSSVKVLKGEERPIHEETARATVLHALACVDMVVLFGANKAGEDNTAIKLLEDLKPDIYFKGGDYKVEDIPEAPTVINYGGEVNIMNEVEGYSTTRALEKMQA